MKAAVVHFAELEEEGVLDNCVHYKMIREVMRVEKLEDELKLAVVVVTAEHKLVVDKSAAAAAAIASSEQASEQES